MKTEQTHDSDRPSRCVFMEELFTSLEGQTWLDMECIDQVKITVSPKSILS